MPSRTFLSSSFRDDVEFVKPSSRKHSAQVTIQHWQLRDLLSCARSRDEFTYVCGNSVISHNVRTQRSSPLLSDLTFIPTCIAVGSGYLAVGGQRGQVMMKHIDDDWCAHKSVGGSINNSISISAHPTGTRMLISNNDQTIKVHSLPGMEQITTIKLPTAINYGKAQVLESLCKFPDGRKMVAVGDSNQVFLFDVSANGDYNRIATYTATSDAGFSCAWNQYSGKFAVANQDGYISVWDIRHSDKLCKIPTKQDSQTKGAARSVKFSPSGSVDLLMFSEHVSYVHLVDSRTFCERQTLRITPQHYDQHISGITFTPDSSRIFVGVEHSVLEYEVDTVLRRSFPAGSLI
ncbi:4759_t:CDS:10 [Paraglomus brasilianum]|uniref:4759_t:CDS:1 n=1 Tax=Paraglomus brasilianum TaxID=144538 RepID=A0A9N8WAR7_9GLOM|nr:4759_t:CDS:10 [Paraglomus brasilianum]